MGLCLFCTGFGLRLLAKWFLFHCLYTMTTVEDTKKQTPVEVDDDEPDEWDKRINKTGCAEENLKLTLCHADTGDWRQCTKEMEEFKKCWAQNQNNLRTSAVNVEKE